MSWSGSYAEYTAAKATWLARPPCDLLLNVAGGVPLVGLTGFQVCPLSYPARPALLPYLLMSDHAAQVPHLQGPLSRLNSV